MRIKALTPESDRLKDVLLDGRSVMNEACEADDVEGWAMLYDVTDAAGWAGAARSMTAPQPRKVYGTVQFILKD